MFAGIERLTEVTSDPDFWTGEDPQSVTKELARLQAKLDSWKDISAELDELQTMVDLLNAEEDPELEREFHERASLLEKRIHDLQLLFLFDEEYDESNAILSIHPGAGGHDSQDWAEMLLRMYLRWAEAKGFRTRILEMIEDEEAGIKSATIHVAGEYAYGYLKTERGVHRLVRMSPFDTAKRRHTSFASLNVSPELPDDVEIEINPEDLRIDTYRSGGAGGQHVNMTDSAVRITHLSTGIVVSCQNERSQHMNRQSAMQVLRGRLYERMLQERQEQINAIQGEKKEIGWGSQIRSYVLHPYTLVKDHRTNLEKGSVQAVLDGDIDEFILAFLRFRKHGK
ncbi:MAG: peptide chain release factor 2 [Synergistaceae bacterium]|nr:peptide chain release factor 2 [Synergistaceae bacterium]